MSIDKDFSQTQEYLRHSSAQVYSVFVSDVLNLLGMIIFFFFFFIFYVERFPFVLLGLGCWCFFSFPPCRRDLPVDEPPPRRDRGLPWSPEVREVGPPTVWTCAGALLWHPEEKHPTVQQLRVTLCLSPSPSPPPLTAGSTNANLLYFLICTLFTLLPTPRCPPAITYMSLSLFIFS